MHEPQKEIRKITIWNLFCGEVKSQVELGILYRLCAFFSPPDFEAVLQIAVEQEHLLSTNHFSQNAFGHFTEKLSQ